MQKTLKEFKVNKEGSFSITRPYESNQIVQIIEKYIKDRNGLGLNDLIVTDATACMGGDLITFSHCCRFVNGIEIDLDNFDCLMENCKRFKCQNVNLFCQDYLEIFDKLRQDIIYMDPPWGGTDYKTKKEIYLKIGEIDLWSLIKRIREISNTKYIFIKVPLNVCLDFIQYDKIETIYNKNRTETFKLLIIDLKNIILKSTTSRLFRESI